MDTLELESLRELLVKERAAMEEQVALARAEKRKVLRVDSELQIKQIDKILYKVECAQENPQRTW